MTTSTEPKTARTCPEWCTGCGPEPMTRTMTGEHTSPKTRLAIMPASVTTSLSQFYDMDGSSEPELRLHVEMHESEGDAEAFLTTAEVRHLLQSLTAALALLEGGVSL